jgi:hypothetical protein
VLLTGRDIVVGVHVHVDVSITFQTKNKEKFIDISVGDGGLIGGRTAVTLAVVHNLDSAAASTNYVGSNTCDKQH